MDLYGRENIPLEELTAKDTEVSIAIASVR